ERRGMAGGVAEVEPRPMTRVQAAPPPVVPRAPEPKLVEAPRPQPAPIVVAPIAAAPAAVPVRARTQSITLGADESFDTGKDDLKPEGKEKLGELESKLRDVSLEYIAVTVHTDNFGSDVE